VVQSSDGPRKFEGFFKIFAKIELERQKLGRILEFILMRFALNHVRQAVANPLHFPEQLIGLFGVLLPPRSFARASVLPRVCLVAALAGMTRMSVDMRICLSF